MAGSRKPKGRFFWFTFGICMVRIRHADQKNRPFGLPLVYKSRKTARSNLKNPHTA